MDAKLSDIYLVVLYDRHCDDQYVARRTLKDAQKEANKLMAGYGTRYDWQKDEDIEEWLYIHTTGFDEGPRLHIEKIELK